MAKKNDDTEKFFYDDQSFDEVAEFTPWQLIFLGAFFPTLLLLVSGVYIAFKCACI